MRELRTDFRGLSKAAVAALVLVLFAAPVFADGGVTYTNVAEDDGAGITYRRSPMPRGALRQASLDSLPVTVDDFFGVLRPASPMRPFGAPGVAILDYDNDGDQDLYVANGLDSPNSLYSNQLMETGSLSFVDVAAAAGVEATGQDSSGVCYGDTDNDGDYDLYVLGTAMPFHFFENNGDGTFTELTDAGTEGNSTHATSCAMGDLDGDGYLDIVVANTYDNWNVRDPLYFAPTYPGMEHTNVFMNQGGNVFADQALSRGLHNVSNMAGPGLSGAGWSWALSIFDYDQDGDVDILFADNQGFASTDPEEERGYLRLYNNDGTGAFTEVTSAVGLDHEGSWMGLSVADFNCDGYLDFFATNIGEYLNSARHSSYYFGQPDGTFELGGPEGPTVFGWGTSAFDYDNDGDFDYVYHGGTDLLQIIAHDNPGIYRRNVGLCSGDMQLDLEAGNDSRFRAVAGVATSDLNEDGALDVVTASSFDVIPDANLLPMTIFSGAFGSPLDNIALFQLVVTSSIMPGFSVVINPDLEIPGGSLAVEVANGNDNNWMKVRTLGTKGHIEGGSVNRDGIGAVVSLRPFGKPASMHPILGGSSYASQDDIRAEFGLGDSNKAHIFVLWPGGVRNAVYNVPANREVLFPEIPCSYDDPSLNLTGFIGCMINSLNDLVDDGTITRYWRARFLAGGLRAFIANQDASLGLEREMSDAEAGEIIRRTLKAHGLENVVDF